MHGNRRHREASIRDEEAARVTEAEDRNGVTTEDGRILKRLDRVYVSEEIAGKVKAYQILEGSSMSDHTPVQMSLADGNSEGNRASRYCMNAKLLRDLSFKDEVLKAWEQAEALGREKGLPLEATGLQIQWNKSTARWIGPLEERRPEWTQELTWSWRGKGEDTKLLGFCFEDGIQAEAMLQRCQQRITEACNNRLFEKLSICGRIAIANNLWGTANMAKDGKVRKIDSQAKRRLWEEGYRRLEDLTIEGRTTFACWENRRIRGVQQSGARKAYIGLTEKIKEYNQDDSSAEEIKRFYTNDLRPGMVWAWKVRGADKDDRCKPVEEVNTIECFADNGEILIRSTEPRMPTAEEWHQPVEITTIRAGRGKLEYRRRATLQEGADTLTELKWPNGKQFFEVSNSQLRRLITQEKEVITTRLQKWNELSGINHSDETRWKRIWKTHRVRRECYLLWSICFKIVPTNSWRFPSLPRNDTQKQCVRCNLQTEEDTLHCFWNCPRAAKTWRPVLTLYAAAHDTEQRWSPRCEHALIAEKLPTRLQASREWWEGIRGATIWAIWLARNAANFSGENWHDIKIDSVLWYRFSLQVRGEWNEMKCKSTTEEKEKFATRWAFDITGIVRADNDTLEIPRTAPWRRARNHNRENRDPP
ncbi:hypothetical protein R1sor_005701 [Riccia sorocarpa]|uniref:Reverse transcriptase zinc-binding domain-containing protein n=1 Tax=Riccia sorocarpa TaxID=122646 RepID=A0ABD3HP61_9MARC